MTDTDSRKCHRHHRRQQRHRRGDRPAARRRGGARWSSEPAAPTASTGSPANWPCRSRRRDGRTRMSPAARTWTGWCSTAVDTFGRLDVLVSNAGISQLGPIADGDVEGWSAMIDVNLRGVLHGIAAAMPVFRRQGRGHFVTTVSTAGLKIVPEMGVYAATKNAVRTVMEALRQESTDGAIRTTSINPGFVRDRTRQHDRRSGDPRPDSVEHGRIRPSRRRPSPARSRSRSTSPTTSRSARSSSARPYRTSRPHPRNGREPAVRG